MSTKRWYLYNHRRVSMVISLLCIIMGWVTLWRSGIEEWVSIYLAIVLTLQGTRGNR